MSKDVDFTGIFRADAWQMLPALVETDSSGNQMLKVNGIRIGFAQVGVTFDPEEAFTRARIGEFVEASERIEFLVMDPVTLYREKQALALKRNQKSDHLHLETVREFLRLEFVSLCEIYAAHSGGLAEEQDVVATLLDIKTRALEITQDARVRKRIAPFIEGDLRSLLGDLD